MQISYALKSQTNFVSFVYFFIFCWFLQQISKFSMGSSHEEIVEKVLGHMQMKCIVRSEIYLYFSLAAVEESNIWKSVN